MYDIFVLGNNPNWKKIKSKYPFAKKADTFTEAKTKSLTSMFWTVWDDVEVREDFDFTYSIPKWDEEYVHVFKNSNYFDGVSLVPKNKHLSQKEIQYRWFVDKKEIDTVASVPKKYDIFEIETYEQYLEAMEQSSTDMFWMTTPNLKIADDFKFDLYITHHNSYERQENHAFVHLVNDEKLYNGVFLLSKYKPLSAKEIEHRYIVDRKEWDVVASGPKQYDIFDIETYEEYQHALKNSSTEMFWMTTPNLQIVDDFKFDTYFSHDKTYDRNENHAFVHQVRDDKLFNGIFLLSKNKPVTKKEIEHRYIVDRKEWDIVASGPCKYDKFIVDTYEQYQYAIANTKTEMFWMIPSDVNVLDDFKFDIYYTHDKEFERKSHHALLNGVFYDGIFLASKHAEISQKEIDNKFITTRVEEDILATLPVKFDKFTITSYQDYLDACNMSTTTMFWCVWTDVEVVEDFDFKYYVPRYNQHITHVFKNDSYFDGVCLFNKTHKVNEREFKYRFFSEKKEVDYVISYPKKYDTFEIETYEQYLEAMEKSSTDMFWMTTPNVKIADDFKFDLYITHHNAYERQENHAFLHQVNDEHLYNGIFLLSKHKPVSAKEIEHRYIVDRKEWDIVASGPTQYEIFTVDTYEQYQYAMSSSRTEMFYLVPSGITVLDDFKFDIYYTHDKEFERKSHHALLNGVFYDGIFLVSKHVEISQKEIDNKFITTRVEEDILASNPVKFDKFKITTYNDYLEAMNQSSTSMFWAVWSDVEVVEDFDFEYYVPRYNQHITHVFKNGSYFDGVCLFNKQNKVNEKEFKYRFFSEKKEVDYVISYPKPYDKFTVDTYAQYLDAKTKSTTDMFYMVPSDINILDDFKYDIYFSHHNTVERQENHALLNGDYYDGIFLVSKYSEISQKEIENKFIVERKEEEILASTPVKFDKFEITTYQDYVDACEDSKTNMFWAVWTDVEVVEDFDFEYYVPRYNQHITHVFKNGEHFDGVCLFSKQNRVNEKEFKYRFFSEKKEIDYVISYPKAYDKFIIQTYAQYLEAIKKSSTDLFWVIPSGVTVVDNFNFDLYFSHHNQYDRNVIHSFQNSDFYDGVMLVPKSVSISEKEFNYGHIVDKKEYEILASTPAKFDKFEITTYDDYLTAIDQSTTGMFWAVWSDVEVVEDFEYNYYVPKYEQHIPHVFKNGEYFDGVCLFSVHEKVSEKEFKYRFFNEKKEIDYIASYPKPYDIFTIETYDQYLEAMTNSSTDMFWMTTPNVKIADNFKFDVQCSRFENHAFVHLVNDEKLYNGIFLLSKHKPVTNKEIEHRYIVDRKEWDIVASEPCKYDKFIVETYAQYLEAMTNSKTEMFWAVSNNIKINDNFEFDLYFSHDRIYDRKENHAFIHLVNERKLFSGVYLLSKHTPVSEKEIVHRYIIDRKEWDIIASGPCEYDKFTITNYTQYLEAMEKSKTEMFWMIPSEVEPLDTFKFDTYFTHDDVYNRNMHHSFKHLFRGEENYNGINLMSKYVPITEKEVTFRYIVEKKEWDVTASKVKPYDIVFISYNESNADENFDRVNALYPRVKRVHGVKGIHQAHIKAAEQATTDNFWVVDGDAVIADDFEFNYEIPVWEHNTVHVWRSQNPVNNLVYGYGGVKLLPRQLTLDMDVTRPDMTTSISDKFKPVQVVSNVTAFNTDEFSTWKSAFRECAKLAGKTIDRQVDTETEERLTVWCTEGADKPFGEFAIKGALAGRKFATDCPEDLFKINDFDWLYEQYEKDCSK
jgi:CYTH domain-containing protein